MPDYGSPLRGFMNGFLMAQQLRRARQEQDMLQQREMDAQRRAEREDLDFQIRLLAAGARPVTPGDEFEAATGKAYDVMPDPRGLPTLRERRSDLAGRIVKTSRGSFVMPSEFEREQKAERTALKSQAIEREGSRRQAEDKLELQRRARAQELEQVGVPVDRLGIPGLPPGLRVLPQHVAELSRLAPQGRTIKNVSTSVDDSGRQTQILTYSDGTVVERALKARGKTKAAGEGGLTPYQQQRLAKEDRKFTAEQQKATRDRAAQLQKEHDALDLEERNLYLKAKYLTDLKKLGFTEDKSGKQFALKKKEDHLAAAAEIDRLNLEAKNLEQQKTAKLRQKDALRGKRSNDPAGLRDMKLAETR